MAITGRQIFGFFVLLLGLVILIFGYRNFVGLIYGVIISVVGILISINKSEDKIEQIKNNGEIKK